MTIKARHVLVRTREDSVTDKRQRLLQRVVASWMNKVVSTSARTKSRDNTNQSSLVRILSTSRLGRRMLEAVRSE